MTASTSQVVMPLQSIVGGAGNDTFNFGAAATSTSGAQFYFGSGWLDSIYSGGQATAITSLA